MTSTSYSFLKLFVGAIFLAWLTLISANAYASQTVQGRVVSVIDGDSIIVLDANKRQHRIRLLGIDAPERTQAFGAQSRRHLASMVAGKDVVVHFKKRDRYERVLGKVEINGKDVNLVMVHKGMAWHYKQFERSQSVNDRSLYAQAQKLAQEQRKGLWADKNVVAPWDFRRK